MRAAHVKRSRYLSAPLPPIRIRAAAGGSARADRHGKERSHSAFRDVHSILPRVPREQDSPCACALRPARSQAQALHCPVPAHISRRTLRTSRTPDRVFDIRSKGADIHRPTPHCRPFPTAGQTAGVPPDSPDSIGRFSFVRSFPTYKPICMSDIPLYAHHSCAASLSL